MSICPCGIEAELPSGTVAFTQQWHREHKTWHFAVFPNVDSATIRNFDDNIRRSVPLVRCIVCGGTLSPALLDAAASTCSAQCLEDLTRIEEEGVA